MPFRAGFTSDDHPSGLTNSKLYTSDEAAAFLGLSRETLSLWRCTQRYNLPFVKIGRLVKYKEADLLAFVESRRHTGVSDEARK
jgi:excisionase family DNA binding protein